MRIMFVCTGNICRSPLAHRMLEKLARERGMGDQIHVESSGTDHWHVGEEADSRMRRTAAAHGLKLSHRARRLTREDMDRYDLVIAMGSGHLRSIRSLTGGRDGARNGSRNAHVRLFREFDPAVDDPARAPDVPDPYYGGPDGFEDVYRIVERTSNALLDAIEEGQFRNHD